MTNHHEGRVIGRAPLTLRVSRGLDRRGWRGGSALERLARARGWLARTARYDLGRGITVDVPLDLRPMDETDIREYEIALVQRIASAINAMEGPVRLFDCGADFGLIALKLVARCPSIARLVAIEPNPAIHPALGASLSRLPCPAQALLAAVGDSIGRGTLCSPRHDPDSDVSRFIEPDTTGTVPITTIDVLAADDDDGCVVVKCDVEGSEAAVLRGAQETLRRAKHFLIAFEAHPDHVERTGIDPMTIVRALGALRPCSAMVAETGVELADDTPLFDQLGERRIVNIICESLGESPVARLARLK